MYAKRICSLSRSMEPTTEDFAELSMYSDVDQYKCDIIVDELEKKKLETIKKISTLAIGKKNRREVIDAFN